MRWLVVLTITGFTACTQQPGVVPMLTKRETPPAATPAAPSASMPTAAVGQPRPGFHLVAELPYPASLAPLGKDALLVAGDRFGQMLLSIEGNQLGFRPELSRLDQPSRPTSFVSAAGGTWPDNAWLAVSGTSDAGPASSDVYRWASGYWAKKHEHDSGVTELAPWRGNLVMQGTFFSVPMLIEQRVEELASTGTKNLKATICDSGSLALAPPLVHDGSLSVFGYECGQNGGAPEQGMALLIETWSSQGKKSQQRVPLPGDSSIERLVAGPTGVAAVLSAAGSEPRRLARLVQDQWQTVSELAPDVALVASPGTRDLWAVVGSQLRLWSGLDWSTLELPTAALPRGASWQAVWRRGQDDVWLLAATGERTWLFNSKDGKRATPLPSDAERKACAATMTQDPYDCAATFFDFLALQPFQLGADFATTLSPEKARRVLRAALAQDPRFRQLELVRHGCYGEDCIGAKVSDKAVVEAFYQALARQTRAVPELERAARSEPRCYPPPETKPFPLR